MEHELPKVLDGVDEPITVEELEEVVRRAGQRRRASLVAGAAGLLLFGAVGGALARGPGDDSARGFASSQGETPSTLLHPPPPPSMAGPAMFPSYGDPLTPRFRREANGVAIRVYRGSAGRKPSHIDPVCMPDTIHGELSNAAAVGFAFAPELKGDQFLLLGAGSFGEAEREPVTWVAVRPGTASTVRFRLGPATDSMAPQDGLAFLAVPGSSGNGVVEALDADGKVVATQQLSAGTHPPPHPACMPPPCVSESGAAGVEVITTMPPPPFGPPTTAPAAPPPPPIDQKAADPAAEKKWSEAEPNQRGPFLGESVETAIACGPPEPHPVPPPDGPVPRPAHDRPAARPEPQSAPSSTGGPATTVGAVSPTTAAPTSVPPTAAPNASTSTTAVQAP